MPRHNNERETAMKCFIELTKHTTIASFGSKKEPYIDEFVKILVNVGKIYCVHKLVYSDDKSLHTRIILGENNFIEVVETYEEVMKMIEEA